MVNFEKIDELINLIENNKIIEGMTFNEFFIYFFDEVKLVPLSKYLNSIGKTSKLPKIMNSKKAGELLKDTLRDENLLNYVKLKSKNHEIPEMNFKTIMLLRKIEPKDNWDKIFRFIRGGETVDEINASTRPTLLPSEIKILKENLIDKLQIDEKQCEWFLSIYKNVKKDNTLLRSVNKLVR